MPALRLLPRLGARHGAVAPLLAAFALLLAAPARAQDAGGAPAVPVTVATAALRDLPVELRNIGAVQANQTVLIRTRVDGTLDQVFFTEGQEVKRGDKIAQIDPRPYQATLDQAQAKRAADLAQLANARLDLGRSTQLARSQFASRQTVDTQGATVAQLEAQVKSDDASVAAAQLNLTYTTITAPFDGRLGLRQVDPGNVVRFADTSGVGIVTLSQIHPIAVLFNVPQDQVPAIQAAMAKRTLPVTAYRSDDKTRLGEGTLLTMDNAVDAASGTIRLKALFPNTDNALWPGQFVNASLLLDVRRGVLTVPSVAVQHGPGNLFVYVVKPDSTVAVQTVAVGQDDGRVAMITKGLDAGARVVVNGQSRLRQGTHVTVTEAKPNA
ncbi:MAG: efflux RND transporter periplasmic adaptor subunit [Rhodospirillales bacterium]|nr:efflux RND transporter periplasmic adaptor subunit [Rhodospirillales bacterium]